MFARFTDRARKSMALADAEARRLGQPFIEAEHILLGLLAEGSGVGANVLKNLGVSPADLRADLERRMASGSAAATASGKRPPSASAKKVIERAIQEAGELSHNYVGTEHLLLGLVGVGDAAIAEAFAAAGITAGKVREETLGLLGALPAPSGTGADEPEVDRARLRWRQCGHPRCGGWSPPWAVYCCVCGSRLV